MSWPPLTTDALLAPPRAMFPRNRTPEGGYVVCDAREAFCQCALPYGHDGPHQCECGGAWSFVGGEWVAVALPGGFG